MKKAIVIIFAAMFCLLAAFYCLDSGRKATLALLKEKGKTATKDYMLSSQSVTSIASDRRELVWIGTSAGINVYDGKDYVQFSYDIKDTAALPDDYINVLHLDRKAECGWALRMDWHDIWEVIVSIAFRFLVRMITL